MVVNYLAFLFTEKTDLNIRVAGEAWNLLRFANAMWLSHNERKHKHKCCLVLCV